MTFYLWYSLSSPSLFDAFAPTEENAFGCILVFIGKEGFSPYTECVTFFVYADQVRKPGVLLQIFFFLSFFFLNFLLPHPTLAFTSFTNWINMSAVKVSTMDNLECEWLFTLEATVFDSHGVGIVITGKMADEHILLLSDTQLIKSWIFFF